MNSRHKIPRGLGPDARRAVDAVLAHLHATYGQAYLDQTTFYSPKQWADREEPYGNDAILVLVHDGGYLAQTLSGYGRAAAYQDLAGRLAQLGLRAEQLTGWSTGLYRNAEAQEPVAEAQKAVAEASYPTPWPEVDAILGGGIPQGRLTEIINSDSGYGDTLAYLIIGRWGHRLDIASAWVDAPHRFEPDTARRCGVDLADLLVAQPSDAEAAFGIAEDLIRHGDVDQVVLDLCGITQDVITPSVVTRALRRLAALAARHNAAVIFLTEGGALSALKFYCSIRLEVRATDLGELTLRTVKNKIVSPFKTAVIGI